MDSGQTARMRRLVWIHAGLLGFVVRRLIFHVKRGKRKLYKPFEYRIVKCFLAFPRDSLLDSCIYFNNNEEIVIFIDLNNPGECLKRKSDQS
jgi:hypothetical protein